MGVLQQAAVIRGDIGLALGAVDEQRVDLVQVLGGQLYRGGEAGAAQTHQAAGPDRVLEGLQVGDHRGSDRGVHLLLAVRDDDHGGLHRAVGGGDGGDAVHDAGHAGVDVGGDKAAGLAHHGTHIDLVALGHSGRSRSTDVLGHGQDDLRRQRHHYRLEAGSPLLMGDSRALRGTFEKFTHSDFDLPNTAIAGTLDTCFILHIRSESHFPAGAGTGPKQFTLPKMNQTASRLRLSS